MQVNDVDYLMVEPGLDEYSTQENLFNADKAVEYKAKAMEELAGQVTFPILVYMPYNASNNATTKRVQVIEQQMEGVLGTDFIRHQCSLAIPAPASMPILATPATGRSWKLAGVRTTPTHMSGFDPLLKSSNSTLPLRQHIHGRGRL